MQLLLKRPLCCPTVFMFMIGMCVVGLGIYRYQQVASLRRGGTLRLGSWHSICNRYKQSRGHGNRYLQQCHPAHGGRTQRNPADLLGELEYVQFAHDLQYDFDSARGACK